MDSPRFARDCDGERCAASALNARTRAPRFVLDNRDRVRARKSTFAPCERATDAGKESAQKERPHRTLHARRQSHRNVQIAVEPGTGGVALCAQSMCPPG